MNEYEITLWIEAYLTALKAGLKYPPATVMYYPQGSSPEEVTQVRDFLLKKYNGAGQGEVLTVPSGCQVKSFDPCEENDKLAERTAELALASFRRVMKGGDS